MSKKRQLTDVNLGKLFDVVATAIIVTDEQLRVKAVNAAAEALLALSARKLIGLALNEIIIGPPELVQIVGRMVADRRSFTQRDLELTLLNLNREIVDCTISPWVEQEDGSIKVVIELASVERHQRIKVEEMMILQSQATTDLMRGIAHEVKNPLGGIRGAAQLLERELDDQNQAEYTQIIIGEADRLRALVDRMLGSQEVLVKQAVNIHEVLERVRRLVEVEHTSAIAINRDYDPSLPEIEGDADQLIQAFLNLVRNAVRAIEGCDGSITVRTRAQRKFTIGETVHRAVMRIDVIDTGSGVAPDIADRIFYPMVTGHADGTGLGLPLAQSIINRQGGLIGFKSEPGNTKFTAWLPIEVKK
ncbi:MAG: two-component system nitrogen regulation sensor histidine kinase GlnL [Gammaproteobacteria bacterium]|jgi:two-component system nitrogen regulation sensor histidine kinase GlnL